MAFISVTFRAEEIQAFATNLLKFKSTLNSYMYESFEYLLDWLHAGSPVDTGEFLLSWDENKRQDGGMSFGNDAEYAITLEEGLYPGVGPKTIQTPRGTFSTQAKDGIINPIVERPEKYGIDKAIDDLIGKVMVKIGVS